MNVLLPSNAKYAFFVDDKNDYHHEWDMVWSLTFKILDPGNISVYLTTEDDENIQTENGSPLILETPPIGEYGFCTFLTKNPSISSFKIGHYMGFFDGLSSLNGEVAIALDSTGLFALSSTYHPNGESLTGINPNSLVIRDTTGVIYNQPLPFEINSGDSRTIRFRYINKNEISVDYKVEDELYQNITRVPITTTFENTDKIYPTFFYTSPVSSNEMSDTILYLQNFHVQGNTSTP